MRAIKLYSRVAKDHTLSLRLPEDVAEGPAEVIVLIPEDRERPSEPLVQRRLVDELDEIALHCARLPVLDPRTPDEILGYDEHGLPR
jgi:antitoxin VapB